MHVDIYGKNMDKTCQAAVAFFKTNKVSVKFYNVDFPKNIKNLIRRTKHIQTKGNFSFKSKYNQAHPIIICDSTEEVLVGFNIAFYTNILPNLVLRPRKPYHKKTSYNERQR